MMIRFGGALLLALVTLAAAPAPAGRDDLRVEPPFWWLGFEDRQLQLMVHAPMAGELTPSVDYPGVSIARVVSVPSPNYLFVYLHIDPSTEPGAFDLVLARGDRRLSRRYRLRARNADPGHARGFDSADAIYLITPDRFANAVTDNDNLPGLGDEVDRSKLGGRHGGDLAGIRERLGYIDDMGFTAIWLNPVLENAMPEYSYHGYATTDFYRVDPRYGSNEEYRDLVIAARARGIGTIMDMIVNHIGSGHRWMDDLPTPDWINNRGRYAQTTHMRTTWQDPYVAERDRAAFADGWFAPTMPDLNQRNPLLADYLVQNALWWIEYLGLAGIRMDTYPYPDRDYMAQWTRRVMREYPHFNIVGEEWSLNPAIVSYWQRGKVNHDGYVSYLPSVMDFPLRETLVDVLTAGKPAWGSSWEPLYAMLANDFLYPDPEALVIFPDNHDMSRIHTQLGEDDDLYRMAIAYVLTMRGTPQIYYGTEIQMVNRASDDHGLIRSDFPGGWAGDGVNGFTGKGLGEAQKAAKDFMRRLLNWRKATPVLHHGRLMHYSPIGEAYAYFRYDERDTVMVAFNKAHEAVELDRARFAERLAGRTEARDVLSGRRATLGETIRIPARGLRILHFEGKTP